MKRMRRHWAPPRIGSSGGLGSRASTSAAGGSTTSASAGSPSVTRFTQSSWSGRSGRGTWRAAMRWTPSASATVTMAASPSGTAATASETAVTSTCGLGRRESAVG